MLKTLILGFVLLTFSIVVGCSDDDGPISPTEPQFSVSQFPTELGMWWRYESIDTIFHPTIQVSYDTIFVQVIDSITPRPPIPAGHRQMIWRYDYGDYLEQRDVRVTSNSIMVEGIFRFEFVRDSWPVSYWEFPLKVGSAWSLNPGFDTAFVALYDFVEVPTGNFTDGYQVRYHWTGEDSWSQQVTWLVPEVGIVYHRFGVGGMVASPWNSTWQLIDWFGAHTPID